MPSVLSGKWVDWPGKGWNELATDTLTSVRMKPFLIIRNEKLSKEENSNILFDWIDYLSIVIYLQYIDPIIVLE